MEKHEVLRLLPRVGDVRMEHFTIDKHGGIADVDKPQRCVVVEVNREHMWYRVQFENGFTECYKVPKLSQSGGAW